MGRWTLLLGGLLVWAVHFFMLYGLASAAPGTQLARTGALLATGACLVADAILILYLMRERRTAREAFDRWLHDLGGLAAALSLVAVLWQGLPPLFA